MKTKNKKIAIKLPRIFKHRHTSKKRWMNRVVTAVMAIVVGLVGGSIVWYQVNIQPVNRGDTKMQLVEVSENDTSSDIARSLKNAGIIKSKQAFYIYTRLSGDANKLQAGAYRLSPSMNVATIVSHLANGTIDQFQVTLYPGATLVDNTSNSSRKYAVTTVLKNAGYSQSEISSALAKKYAEPSGLYDGKPDSADLEGYIYGDTYSFEAGETASGVVQTALDKFYNVVQSNDLKAKFAKHGLNLYQGITLASIVQREASNAADQKHVAQVFYTRLDQNIALGSDVTYQYIADKLGETRDPSIDSPYNTRLYKGLPPGPISVPGLTALQAVANPADGSYLYFLAGDDGTMHYAYTESEHEANIKQYCKIQCSTN